MTEQLMSVGMYTVPEQASSPMSMSRNIGSLSPRYISQSLASWVTQSKSPPLYQFPPSCSPHPSFSSHPFSPATVQVPSFSQLTHASECVLPTPGCHGPLQHADVHSYLESQFVEPLQHLHVPNPQYQWPSHTIHYWSASTGTTSHQQQVVRWGPVAEDSRNGGQIARPIPVYRYPMPGYTRPSTSMHDESPSTSMREKSPLTSVHDASPREISAEDGAQENSRGQLETPSESKVQSDAKELDEYKEFATAFKSHRLKMGYSQSDVMQQIGIRYGASISQETIDHFEGLQLTITAVRTLKATLEQWVRDTAKASGTSEEEIKKIIFSPTTSINPKRERKQRRFVDAYKLEAEFQRKRKPTKVEMGLIAVSPTTSINPKRERKQRKFVEDQLEAEFQRKHKPTKVEMDLIANRLQVDKDFVRIWFANKRQRQKKIENPATTLADLWNSSDAEVIKIPSHSHDITVEVSSSPDLELNVTKLSFTLPSNMIQ